MRIETRIAAAAVATAGFLAGPAALADPSYPPATPSNSPASFTGGGGGVVTPVTGGGGGSVVAPTGGGGVSLPRTGQDIALLALVGGAAAVAGAGVVLAVRRPRVATAAQEERTEPDD